MHSVLCHILYCLARVEDVHFWGCGLEQSWREEIPRDHHVGQGFRQDCIQEFCQIARIQMRVLTQVGVLLLGLLSAGFDQPDNIIANIVQVDNKLLIGAGPQLQAFDNSLIEPDILLLLGLLQGIHPLGQQPEDDKNAVGLGLVLLHAVGAVLEGQDLVAEGPLVGTQQGHDVLHGLLVIVQGNVIQHLQEVLLGGCRGCCSHFSVRCDVLEIFEGCHICLPHHYPIDTTAIFIINISTLSNFSNSSTLALHLAQQFLQHVPHLLANFFDLGRQFLIPLGPKLRIIEPILVISPIVEVLDEGLDFGQALIHAVAGVQADYLVEGLVVVD